MNAHILPALKLLWEGDFRSGEDIAGHLGVTRATVWNALKEAQALGVELEKVRGLGYRVAHLPVWLDARVIADRVLKTANRKVSVVVLDTVDSTNTYLLQQVGSGAPSGTVVIAELQTSGKGRRGRTWMSGLGGALTFSLLWRFEQSVAALSGLSLAVGLAVVSALKGLGVDEVGLKWPNDIVVSERKLGGILIELLGDSLGPTAAVIGIGINVRLSDALRQGIDQPVIDLATLHPINDRNELVAAMLAHLVQTLERFMRDGYAALEQDYRRVHVLQGAEVTVNLPDGKKVHGKVNGTAPDGALILDTGSGISRFHGGEVSVRKRPATSGTARA